MFATQRRTILASAWACCSNCLVPRNWTISCAWSWLDSPLIIWNLSDFCRRFLVLQIYVVLLLLRLRKCLSLDWFRSLLKLTWLVSASIWFFLFMLLNTILLFGRLVWSTNNSFKVLESNHDNCHVVQTLSIKTIFQNTFNPQSAILVHTDLLFFSIVGLLLMLLCLGSSSCITT